MIGVPVVAAKLCHMAHHKMFAQESRLGVGLL